ncbi:hypothetical protein [uncultured Enterococcus sp.]|uniref:hypothetical protein n=1 Tax=uncultured Enterococcus sp. TaxID=167972 RepID=UPI002AA6438B|nr:hypothetical protein [uncultured Enterococcus sp.]
MKREEIENEVLKINNYLDKCLWMEFECTRMNEGKILISGRIDISSSEFAIDIEFENPYYVASLMSWQLDDSRSFIELLSGDDEMAANDKYQVEKGNLLFKVNAEDFNEAPIFIAAQNIKCSILIENPF